MNPIRNLTLSLFVAAQLSAGVEPVILSITPYPEDYPGWITQYVVPSGKVLVIEQIALADGDGGVMLRNGAAVLQFEVGDTSSLLPRLVHLSRPLKIPAGWQLLSETPDGYGSSYMVFGLLVDPSEIYLTQQTRIESSSLQDGQLTLQIATRKPRPASVEIEKSTSLEGDWIPMAQATVKPTANPYRHTITVPVEDPKTFVRAKVDEVRR